MSWSVQMIFTNCLHVHAYIVHVQLAHCIDKLGLMTVERKDCKARNFCWENFWAFSPPALTCKIFNLVKYLSRVNDYIEPIAIFITWTKI